MLHVTLSQATNLAMGSACASELLDCRPSKLTRGDSLLFLMASCRALRIVMSSRLRLRPRKRSKECALRTRGMEMSLDDRERRSGMSGAEDLCRQGAAEWCARLDPACC